MSGLGTVVIVLGGAVLAALLIRIVSAWMLYQAMFVQAPADGLPALDTFVERLGPALVTAIAGTLLLVPAAIAAVATTLVWVHRARTNAALLSPYLRFRHTPALSVIGLLIPSRTCGSCARSSRTSAPGAARTAGTTEAP